MIVLLSGLSGVGKTTLAKNVKRKLEKEGLTVEVIDGDDYRKTLCKDLGFSKQDQIENIRRLGLLASKLSGHGIVCIISAINPYQEIRKEIQVMYKDVKTIFLDCPISTLISRDTKGLYKRALLPAGHPDKIDNLTGVNDEFETPYHPDLYINTAIHNIKESASDLFSFIRENLPENVMRRNYAHS